MPVDTPLASIFARLVWFPINRLWKNGDSLTQYSAPQNTLLAELAGKTVAIVGNSRALAKTGFGADIERADIVVRINGAPMPSSKSHGHRTNWLALAVALGKRDGQAIAPERVLWMSPKRKRLPFWVLSSPGFHLFSLEGFQTLKSALGAPPTTGVMAIDLVQKSDARSIKIYGFDFFSSLSLTGSRTQAQVPHDFSAEKKWVAELKTRDDRITVFT